MLVKENVKRTKIHFTIQCPDGKVRFITIRDEDGGTVKDYLHSFTMQKM